MTLKTKATAIMFLPRYLRRRFSSPSFLLALTGVLFVGGLFVVFAAPLSVVQYNSGSNTLGETVASDTPPVYVPVHLPTPEPLKGLYMTSWVGGYRDAKGKFSWREGVVKLIDETELNAIVIDIKDATGRISYEVRDPRLVEIGAATDRIPDIREFVKELHDKGIYVIGRVSVFQDPFLVGKRPEWAVRRASDGEIWKDKKGITWLDPSVPEVWDYVVAIGRDAYADGFDEINFDYIRFPSDGDMKNIAYRYFNEASSTKPALMRQFYKHLHDRLKPDGITISADLFGMTTTNNDDLGIGQKLESALPYFDYVCPMVYPSHFPPQFNGWPDPNLVPGLVVKFSMGKAVERALAASTTPHTTFGFVTPRQLRPWLQDFDYGGNYGETEVRAQKEAVYAVGLTSWTLWDPGVRYTREALDTAPVP